MVLLHRGKFNVFNTNRSSQATQVPFKKSEQFLGRSETKNALGKDIQLNKQYEICLCPASLVSFKPSISIRILQTDLHTFP